MKRAERKKFDKKRLEEEKKKADEIADWSLELYSKASKTGTSPYIENKKIKFTENIRYQTELNSDSGETETRILVPLCNIKGKIRALQVIYPSKRLFNNGDKEPRDKHFIGKYSGCFFTFGKFENTKQIRVCEGFSTASTVFQFTGDTTVAAISRTNLEGVCQQLKNRYPNSEIIICADNDLQTTGNPGLTDAVHVSRNLGLKIAYPRFTNQKQAETNAWSDFNDLFTHKEGNAEQVKNQLNELFEWQMVAEATGLELQQEDKTTFKSIWLEPKPIQAPLHPVPLFDAEIMLPEVLRTWVMDEAYRMPCPPDFIAAAVIVTLGTIVGARCAIKPKSRDSWMIVPNLWGGIVGLPSAKKSPAISAALNPLDRLITQAKETHQEKLETFEVDKIINEAEQALIESEIKAAVKSKKKSDIEKIAQEMQNHRQRVSKEPILRRYKSNDPTVEKLGELLRDNPAGLLILRDELVGLISSWDKDGREGDRTFYLEAWNGNGSFDTDRIKRGSILIPNLCVSLFGGIQPDKLVTYLERASKSLSNDGLLQRFQILVYPDHQNWEWRDIAPNCKAREDAFTIFETLANFDPVAWGAVNDVHTKFPYFSFDDQAQTIFIEWSKDLHLKRLVNEDNPLIEQHLAKFDKLFPALALLFHLVDCVKISGQNQGIIKAESALRAAAWCEYLEAHARRCYGLLADDGLRAAQALAKKIQQGKLKDNFTARDVRRNQWCNLTTDGAVQAALDWLEDEGWLQSYEVGGTGPGMGRPTWRYRINPRIVRLKESGNDGDDKLA